MDDTGNLELEEFLLKQLDAGNDVMLFDELSGFLTALAICPVQIPTETWMSHIWSPKGDPASRPAFQDDAEADRVAGLILDYQGWIISSLDGNREDHPQFEIDEITGDVIWESWIEGFSCGMHLAPQFWLSAYEYGDEQVRYAVGTMINLHGIAHDDSDLPEKTRETAAALAPELITAFVPLLYQYGRSTEAQELPAATMLKKVGRNEPCPCGSGKKYKKCHGA